MPDTATRVIAIWGAVLGTLSFGWNLYKHWLERPRLKVSCFIAHLKMHFLNPSGGTYFERDWIHTDQPPFLAYEIVNIGRQSVVIEKVGGVYKNGERFFVDYAAVRLPKKIEPLERVRLAASGSLVTTQLRYLAVWDSVGHMRRLGWLAMRRLKRRAAEQLVDRPEQPREELAS
jgi:hypothetical protein